MDNSIDIYKNLWVGHSNLLREVRQRRAEGEDCDDLWQRARYIFTLLKGVRVELSATEMDVALINEYFNTIYYLLGEYVVGGLHLLTRGDNVDIGGSFSSVGAYSGSIVIKINGSMGSGHFDLYTLNPLQFFMTVSETVTIPRALYIARNIVLDAGASMAVEEGDVVFYPDMHNNLQALRENLVVENYSSDASVFSFNDHIIINTLPLFDVHGESGGSSLDAALMDMATTPATDISLGYYPAGPYSKLEMEYAAGGFYDYFYTVSGTKHVIPATEDGGSCYRGIRYNGAFYVFSYSKVSGVYTLNPVTHYQVEAIWWIDATPYDFLGDIITTGSFPNNMLVSADRTFNTQLFLNNPSAVYALTPWKYYAVLDGRTYPYPQKALLVHGDGTGELVADLPPRA